MFTFGMKSSDLEVDSIRQGHFLSEVMSEVRSLAYSRLDSSCERTAC